MKTIGDIFLGRELFIFQNILMKKFSLQCMEYQNNWLTLLAFSGKLILQENFPTCSHVKWMEMKADLGPVPIWFILETGSNQTR